MHAYKLKRKQKKVQKLETNLLGNKFYYFNSSNAVCINFPRCNGCRRISKNIYIYILMCTHHNNMSAHHYMPHKNTETMIITIKRKRKRKNMEKRIVRNKYQREERVLALNEKAIFSSSATEVNE